MGRGQRGADGPGEKPTDGDQGIWHGRSVARRFVSPDGLVILVGRSAADNDVLTFQLASPRDFWLHVAAESGSHVVVRNPAGLHRLPRETQRMAASLAAGHSRARKGGRVAVHLARRADVSKPRGFAPGKVLLVRWESVQASPLQEPPAPSDGGGPAVDDG
jgi:predicted ribosome quality control (RQC) complex YloA/Tae2 family protein